MKDGTKQWKAYADVLRNGETVTLTLQSRKPINKEQFDSWLVTKSGTVINKRCVVRIKVDGGWYIVNQIDWTNTEDSMNLTPAKVDQLVKAEQADLKARGYETSSHVPDALLLDQWTIERAVDALEDNNKECVKYIQDRAYDDLTEAMESAQFYTEVISRLHRLLEENPDFTQSQLAEVLVGLWDDHWDKDESEVNLVDEVCVYAINHYSENGWDVLVECYDRYEVKRAIEKAGAKDLTEALYAVQKAFSLAEKTIW